MKNRATSAPHVVPSLLEIRNTDGYNPQAEIKGKDKALLKEIAALEEDEADQVRRENYAQENIMFSNPRAFPLSLTRSYPIALASGAKRSWLIWLRVQLSFSCVYDPTVHQISP